MATEVQPHLTRDCKISQLQVCEQLHFFLQKAFPVEYGERENDTKGVLTAFFDECLTYLINNISPAINQRLKVNCKGSLTFLHDTGEEETNGVYSLELQNGKHQQMQVICSAAQFACITNLAAPCCSTCMHVHFECFHVCQCPHRCQRRVSAPSSGFQTILSAVNALSCCIILLC